MPAVPPAASSASDPAVQVGMLGRPTEIRPRPAPKAAPESLPPAVSRYLPALQDALGESRGSDSLKRLLVKTWRSRDPALTPAAFCAAIASCRDESLRQSRASYGAYFTSQLPRFVADQLHERPAVRPADDFASAAQRAAEPRRAWREQVPEFDETVPRAGPIPDPPRFVDPGPIVRIAR